jgi:hypothetical protein
MSDPFGDWVSEETVSTSIVQTSDGKPRILLPITLAFMVFLGATMPWIVIRPLGDSRNSYNLTNVPGGIGILVTVFFLVGIGAVIMIWRRVTGMIVMSLAVAALGWMAAISGMLLGIVSSFIPAIEVAGIDLSKAQVGQGYGVVVSVIFSLILAFLCVRQLEPIAQYSPSFEFPVIQLASLIPMLVITGTIHQGWLVLGNPDAQWHAEVPGDSLYGSGLVIMVLWLGIGLWLTSAVLRRPFVMRIAGALAILLAVVMAGYTLLVWIGGRALAWLLPSSVEGWASVKIEASLYATALSAIAVGVLGIVGIVTASRERVVKLNKEMSISSLRVPLSDLFAYVLILFALLWMVFSLVK